MIKRATDVVNTDGVHLGWMIFCPACKCGHRFEKGRWTFDGNYESPTFAPSMLVWWDEGPGRVLRRCHSFVRNGRIEFLGDCLHDMKGTTVELPPMSEA